MSMFLGVRPARKPLSKGCSSCANRSKSKSSKYVGNSPGRSQMLARQHRKAYMTARWEQEQISTNGVSLHVVQAGPIEGPLVILLHGFPEYWGSWRRYIQPLAGAGYRVWVPDQRGYNLSSKPQHSGAYTLD